MNYDTNSSAAKKRKREASNKTETPINKSFSQMSISQGRPKKNKAFKKMNNGHRKQRDRLPDSSKSTLLPGYLTTPDRAFKHMLAAAAPDGCQIMPWLDTAEKLQSARQLISAVNTLKYMKLQQQLWQEYYHIAVMQEACPSRITKTNAKAHHTCPSVGRPLKVIQQRQKTIEHQLKRTENELHQMLLRLPEWTDKAEPPMSSVALSTAISACVDKGQQRLCAAFKHKHLMLKLDAYDHQLINALYALQPNDEQIRLAKLIWQGTADQCKAEGDLAILRKRVFLKRLPASLDTVINQSIEHIRALLSDPNLNKNRRAILTSHLSKMITQYKFDLVALNIVTLEDSARAHAQVAIDATNKLSILDGDTHQSSIQDLIQAIEARQHNLKQRAEELLNHQLQTFFEQAPTEVDDADDSVPVGATM